MCCTRNAVWIGVMKLLSQWLSQTLKKQTYRCVMKHHPVRKSHGRREAHALDRKGREGSSSPWLWSFNSWQQVRVWTKGFTIQLLAPNTDVGQPDLTCVVGSPVPLTDGQDCHCVPNPIIISWCQGRIGSEHDSDSEGDIFKPFKVQKRSTVRRKGIDSWWQITMAVWTFASNWTFLNFSVPSRTLEVILLTSELCGEDLVKQNCHVAHAHKD